MGLRVSRLGALLFVAASCSSGGTTEAQSPALSTTITAATVAPATTHVDSLTPDEVAIAQKWLERLATETASYSADFQCGICAIGGLFSITEQHGAMRRFTYTGTGAQPDGEPWTLTKALSDALASGGNSSVTEVGDSGLIVHVDMDPFPEDDAEYTYRADQIRIIADESTSPSATEDAAVERTKDCPIRSLTAIDALVSIVPASSTLTPIDPPIGGSAVASVRVEKVLWAGPDAGVGRGDSFDGLVYAHSTTAADWGFDDAWLAGSTPLIAGLARNQIRQVDVPWEFETVLQEGDGSLRFPMGCFTERFEDLARRTNRPATVDLYIDLLKGEPQVVEQAHEIDDALPGE